MFYRYNILNEKGESILYLYLNNQFELANDFRKKEKEESFSRRVENYIRNQGIKFLGNKIYLVVDGIITSTLSFDPKTGRVTKREHGKKEPQEIEILEVDDKIEQEIKKTMTDKHLIKLEQINGQIVTMDLDDYLLGVLTSVILPNYEMEVLKAQAILARTYAIKKMIEDGKIKQNNKTQLYRNPEYTKLFWLKNYDYYLDRLKQAIRETKGEYLAYRDQLIEVYYHTLNNGMTENAESTVLGKVPYLKTISSIWDMQAPGYIQTITKSLEEVAVALQVSKHDLLKIEILEITPGNQIKKIKVGAKEFSGDDFVKSLNLPSKDISILVDKNIVYFTTRGIGHGLGMSQFGANQMARNGYTAKEILAYYYPYTKIWSF